jgi:hypothetical protein
MGFLKDLFIVNEDKEKEKEKATPQTAQPQQTLAQSYQYSQATAQPQPMASAPISGSLAPDILDMIKQVIAQNNLEGNDYYEFDKIVESQDFKNAIPDERSRIVAAFHSLRAQDPGFSKQKLVESIDHYKNAVNAEYQNVMQAYNVSVDEKINNPKKQIDSLLETKAELMQHLVELDDKIKTLEAEIAQNTIALNSRRADYEVTFSCVLNDLESEKQQLISILP